MKRDNKILGIAIVALILILVLSINVCALNAKIGNGRVVLYPKVGDVIERYVKVINANNISVNIELFSGGDLKDQIKIRENNFTLAPNEEKDAYYSIKITKEGKTESQINVKFLGVGEKNGIVLPATIIVVASKGNGTIIDIPDNPDNDFNGTNGNNGDITDDNNKINPFIIGLVITAVVFVILLILLYFYSRNKGVAKINQKKKTK